MKDRNKILFGFVMLLMVVGIIGFSYAIFTTKVEKKGALNIVAGTLSCPIQIEGQEGNQVELVNQTEKEVEVTIRNDSQVPIHSTITYSLNDNIEVLISSNDDKLVQEENLSTGETRTYTIKLINKGTNTETVTLNGRCGLSNKTLAIAESEKEITGTYERVKPNAPALVEGLIPVIYDEEKSSWVKADTTKTWYNYDKQEWANAVTVVETTTSQEGHNRDYYQKAEVGEPILMDDINTMWVWIPRYEYKYTNLGNQYAGGTQTQPGEIVINFINGTNDTASNENYKVHPAFNFGEDKLTGFWYGKFETGNQEEIDYSTANNSSLTPIIKPTILSWRGINISNAFYAARNMQLTKSNVYGFNSEEIDTHMSKNSEWGAVAYLSQSKYGKYGNDIYEADDKEVYINNCSYYITGIAGDTASADPSKAHTNTYETKAGQKASTTGNITGVYDMNGGSYEPVMGVLSDNGKLIAGDSEFVEDGTGNRIPEDKYYDLYTTTNPDVAGGSPTACNNGVCYGHALSETAGWYLDWAVFISRLHPWLMRGGGPISNTKPGIFFSDYANGAGGQAGSFRLVLTPIGV